MFVLKTVTVMLFLCLSSSGEAIEGTDRFPVKIRSNFIAVSLIYDYVHAMQNARGQNLTVTKILLQKTEKYVKMSGFTYGKTFKRYRYNYIYS